MDLTGAYILVAALGSIAFFIAALGTTIDDDFDQVGFIRLPLWVCALTCWLWSPWIVKLLVFIWMWNIGHLAPASGVE